MKTAAILNPAITPGTSSTPKSETPSETSFDQALSREVAQRRAAEGKNTQSTKTDKADKTASGDSNNDARPTETKQATSNESAANSETTKAESASNAEEEIDTTALATASDELLALVASASQVGGSHAKTISDASGADTLALTGQAAAKEAALTTAIDSTSQDPATTSADESAMADILARLTATTQDAALSPQTTNASADKNATSIAAGIADTAIATGIEADGKGAKEANTSNGAHLNAAAQADQNVDKGAKDSKMSQGSDGKGTSDLAATKASPSTAPGATSTSPATDVSAAKLQDNTSTITPLTASAQPQAPVQQAQAAAQAATDKLAPRVGNPGWDQALGQKVVWMVAGEQQSASLTLNPPELGPLQVVLNVSNNQATASFTAAQPEVRQALESAMPKLREMLGDAGIQLGQANVSAGTPNNQHEGSGDRRSSSWRTGETDESLDMAIPTSRGQQITGGQGLVDTFA